MTKQEIDKLLDLFSKMNNNDFNEEEFTNFFKELIDKYSPEEDIEHAMEDPKFLKRILAKTESELLDYYEERCYELGETVEEALSFLPDDRKAVILENPHELSKSALTEIVISLESDELIERYIGLLDDPSQYESIIYKTDNNRIKAMLIQRIKDESYYIYEHLIDYISIESSSDEEILIECLKNVSNLSSLYKTKKILSIRDPEIRERALRELEGFDAGEVIKSFDDKKRIELLHDIKDLSAYDIVNVLNSVEDIDSSIPILIRSLDKLDDNGKGEIILLLDKSKRLAVIQNIRLDSWQLAKIIKTLEDGNKLTALETIGYLDEELKTEIICSIGDEHTRIEAMQREEDLDSRNKTKIILSIEKEHTRIEAMQKEENLSCEDKAKIICSIKDVKTKIEAMQREEDFDSRNKTKIILSIKDEHKRIEAMQKEENLWIEDKAKIIRSIKDEQIKIEAMQREENFSVSDKISIINTIEGIGTDEKKRELIHSVKNINIESIGIIVGLIQNADERIRIIKSLEGLSDENKKILDVLLRIYEINNNTIRNIDFRILQPKYLNTLGEEVIIQIVCDSRIQAAVLELPDEQLHILDKCLDVYGEHNETDEKKRELIDSIKDINIETIGVLVGLIEKTDEKIKVLNSLEDLSEEHKESIEALLRMYEINNDVLENIDFRILQPKYLNTLGEERINQIACDSRIQSAVLRLSDEQLYVFDKCLDVYVEQNETDEWTVLAEELLTHIGEYSTLIQSIDHPEDLRIEDITKLYRLMQSDNWCEIQSIEDVREYDRLLAEKCKSIMEDENATLEDKKKAVFQKIFGHDSSYAVRMINKYGEDIENIDDCDVKDYIRSIKLISEIDDASLLQQIFEQCDSAELDKVLAERELKTAYFEKYIEDLYVVPQKEDGKTVTDNIYEVGTDFKMIITAVGAYSGINTEDYKEDWNRPAIASQHFCASYIRNDMIGTAPIRTICYGFSEMKEDALMLSGTGDMHSSNTGFVSTAWGGEKYYTPNEQVERTEYYNEMDFRRIQGGKKLQPSYIVVFRRDGEIANMDEALKAQKHWGGLPIVIVDVDACLEEERRKVNEMLELYDEQPSEELAKQIVQKVRNNRVTSNVFCSDIDGKIDELREVAKSVDERDEKHIEETPTIGQEHTSSEETIGIEEAGSEEPRVTMEDWKENYEGVKSVSEKIAEGNKIRTVYKRIQEVVRGKSSERQQ